MRGLINRLWCLLFDHDQTEPQWSVDWTILPGTKRVAACKRCGVIMFTEFEERGNW